MPAGKETTRSNQKQELSTTGQTPKAHGIGLAEAAASRGGSVGPVSGGAMPSRIANASSTSSSRSGVDASSTVWPLPAGRSRFPCCKLVQAAEGPADVLVGNEPVLGIGRRAVLVCPGGHGTGRLA